MGAGDRGGPERRDKAFERCREDFYECEFRHEHALDEQRLRHRDVAQRRVAQAGRLRGVWAAQDRPGS